jgi:multidrug efflux system outer membrane protein
MNRRCKRVVAATLSLAAGAALVAGCEVGPNYHHPNVVAPAAYGEAHTGPSTRPGPPTDLAVWWKTFHDPELESLVDRSIDGNLTLLTTEARVRQARAQQGATIANLFPFFSVNGQAIREKSSSNLGTGADLASVTGISGVNSGRSSHSYPFYSAAIDATWQLDVFGGLRRAAESAGYSLESVIDARRAEVVTLSSEVATDYVQLRGLQAQLNLTYSNLKTQQDSLDLTRSRFKAGLNSDLDVAQAQAQVATTAAQLPTLETSIKQTIHAISVLLGQEPMALAAELGKDMPIPPAPSEVPVGLPSELLRRRPDVLEAEYNLAAATANIGVQVAQIFPQFDLTGDIGQEASRFHLLTQGASTAYSIGPSVTWRFFEAGQLINEIRVSNAEQAQALYSYKQIVLQSFQDVEDVLVAYAQDQNRTKALADAVAADQRAVDLSNELYTRGLGDFLNVLTAEQSLFAAQQNLVISQTSVSNDLISLYRALGGGWDEHNEDRFHKNEDPKTPIVLD